MLRRLAVIILVITTVLPVLIGCQSQVSTSGTNPPVEGTKVGNLAPDFTLQNLEGQTITLSELRGNPVMLNFWATWCGWCTLEMPFIQQIYQERQDEGLIILAVNKGESLAAASQFIQSNNFTFTVLLDTDEAVSNRYGVSGIPVSVFTDKDGIIQGVKLGAFLAKDEMESYLSKILP